MVRKGSNADVYVLRIADQESVMAVALRILPYCFKKKHELETLLDYRRLDILTGTEVQHRFDHYVEIGMRERHGKRTFVPMDWTFSVGFRRSRMGNSREYRKRWPVLSDAQKGEARERHNVFGESITALSVFYGVSRMAMWRLLKK